MTKEKSCAERVKEYHLYRLDDITKLYHAEEQTDENLGSLYDYGLSIDLVEAGTFKGW